MLNSIKIVSGEPFLLSLSFFKHTLISDKWPTFHFLNFLKIQWV